MEHAAVTYKWVVYLVRCADGTVTLIATAPFPDRGSAQKAEHHVKRLPPDRKQEALAHYAGALPVAARPSAPRTKE